MVRNFITLLLCFLLGACSLSIVEDEVLFVDSFSDNRFFEDTRNPHGSVLVADGVLKITVEQPNGMMVSLRPTELQDVIVAVNGWPQTAGETVFFGIACRFVDNANFVYFSLGSNGDATITKVDDGKVNILAATKPDAPIGSNYGGRINHISGQCNGTELSFSVNGIQALKATDVSPQLGRFGIFASSQYAPRTVFFDDLTVSLPAIRVQP